MEDKHKEEIVKIISDYRTNSVGYHGLMNEIYAVRGTLDKLESARAKFAKELAEIRRLETDFFERMKSEYDSEELKSEIEEIIKNIKNDDLEKNT